MRDRMLGKSRTMSHMWADEEDKRYMRRLGRRREAKFWRREWNVGDRKERYLVQVEGCDICGEWVYLNTDDRNEAEVEARDLEASKDVDCKGRYVIKVVT